MQCSVSISNLLVSSSIDKRNFCTIHYPYLYHTTQCTLICDAKTMSKEKKGVNLPQQECALVDGSHLLSHLHQKSHLEYEPKSVHLQFIKDTCHFVSSVLLKRKTKSLIPPLPKQHKMMIA